MPGLSQHHRVPKVPPCPQSATVPQCHPACEVPPPPGAPVPTVPPPPGIKVPPPCDAMTPWCHHTPPTRSLCVTKVPPPHDATVSPWCHHPHGATMSLWCHHPLVPPCSQSVTASPQAPSPHGATASPKCHQPQVPPSPLTTPPPRGWHVPVVGDVSLCPQIIKAVTSARGRPRSFRLGRGVEGLGTPKGT